VQNTVILIDTYTKALKERDIADQDTKADGNQQKRLILFGCPQIEEYTADDDHNYMAVIGQVITGVCYKLIK
jgi:hypothetical protein